MNTSVVFRQNWAKIFDLILYITESGCVDRAQYSREGYKNKGEKGSEMFVNSLNYILKGLL